MKTLIARIKSTIFGSGKDKFGPVTETPPVNMTNILRSPRNILIVPYNRMGTVLLTTRVFKAIREHYTDSKISVAVYEPWSALIARDPAIDQVIAYGDDIDHPTSKGFQTIGHLLSEQKFDLAFFLSYQFDPAMAYLIRLSDAALRVSFKNEDEEPYFNVEVIPSQESRYEVERYIEMLRTFGIGGTIRDYTLTLSDAILEKARVRYLPGHTEGDSHQHIGFDLTCEIAGDPINKKTAEFLINAITTGFDATVVVFFEPGKRTLAAELKESFGKKVILVEDRPVAMAAGTVSLCTFVLTRNTDLLQLAVALKIPTIAMLTRSERIQWAPKEIDDFVHLERSDGSWPSSGAIVQAARQLLQRQATA